jgi:hypothetical protein
MDSHESAAASPEGLPRRGISFGHVTSKAGLIAWEQAWAREGVNAAAISEPREFMPRCWQTRTSFSSPFREMVGLLAAVGVEDAEALFAEFSAKGARIRSPPQNFDWAYEFQIEDPDGHVLRFGSEPKPGPKGGVFKS